MHGAEKDLDTLLREMRPQRNPGVWVFCGEDVPGAVATFREPEGVTSIVEKHRAETVGIAWSYAAAWITLTVHSDLGAVGFLAAITHALAAEGISCNVVSALYHDHLFVPLARSDDAMRVLEALSCSRSKNTQPTSGSGS